MFRLETDYKDPFPPCMDGSCEVKVSYALIGALSKYFPEVNSKFLEVLCRSYATYSKSVKMCKGRPGIACNRCFAIDKMYDIIECGTCGNFVCPRCGEENHGSAICYYVSNWKKLTEDSTDFVEHLNYRICPYCKEAV